MPLANRRVLHVCLSLSLISSVIVSLQAQTKTNIDSSDAAAFQQELNAAGSQKLSIKNYKINAWLKECNDASYIDSASDARAVCFDIAQGSMSAQNSQNLPPADAERALMRGCALPDRAALGHGENPCVELGKRYVAQGLYLRALLVYNSPSCADGVFSGTEACLAGLLSTYHALGNVAAENLVKHSLCFDAYDTNTCQELQASGVQVDLGSIQSQYNQAWANQKTDKANAQNQGLANENRQPAWLSVLNTMAIATQPSGSSTPSPSYGNTPSTQNTANSTSGSGSSGTCRDMSACIQVVSSSYGNQAGNNQFLHVVVKNVCSETVVAMVSVKAQNRSCTTSQSANLAPGQTEDMGAMTDLNHYSILANDNIFVNGMYKYPSGCTIQPTNCDGR